MSFWPGLRFVYCRLADSVWSGIGCAVLMCMGRLEAVSVFDLLTGLRAGRLFESGARSCVVVHLR